MPDREIRIAVLLDVSEAIVGPEALVIDLACGTGSITRRLLNRFPAARSIAVDVDPVLLAIASATFDGDDRVRIVRADLRDAQWIDALPESSVDGVLTATALHWLPEEIVYRLYRDLARVVRPGGTVAHAERMPLVDLPRLGAGLAEIARERSVRLQGDGRLDWKAWWEQAASDPALAAAATDRIELFGGCYPAAEFSPPAAWHIAAFVEAGFAEAGVVWRSGEAAVVAAVR